MKNIVTLLVSALFFYTTASGQVCNVPITLTNSQNTATPDSFEQMVTVNSSLFASLEMSDLDNIQFTVGSPAPTGTILQAWIESGNSSSDTNTVYWVNLANNVVPANGTLIIYMNFMGSSQLSTTGPTGVAPDISTTYAQYDNGGLVFPHVYTRWGGLTGGTLPTSVNGDAINGGDITSVKQSGSMTITNQTTYTEVAWNNPNGSTAYPGNMNGVYYSTTPTSSYTFPTVLESKVDIGCTYSWFGTGYGVAEEGWGAVVANDNNGGSRPTYSARSNFNLGGSCTSGNHSYQDWSALAATAPVAEVWTIMLNTDINDSDQILTELHSYTPLQNLDQPFPLPINGSGTIVYQAPCNGGLGTLFGYFGTTQNNPNPQPYQQIYWTRTREFPPSGIMPTATVDTLGGGKALALILPIDTTICAGASVTLQAVGGLSYTWSNSDTGSVITVQPTSTSVFIVTAKGGCGTASDTAVVTVDTGAQVLTVLPSGLSFCSGQSATLFVSGGGSAFTWSPAAGLSATTGDSVIATPTVTSTYTVSGTDSIGCPATGTDVIAIIPAPNTPTITISVTGDSLISSAGSYNQWYFNGQYIDSTRNVLVIKGHAKGWYKVVVTNPANGCSATSDSTTSINQLSGISEQLSIYPNPFNNNIFIKINAGVKNIGDWNLEVTDMLGRTLYTKTSLNYNNELDLTDLANGIYFISVVNKTGRAVFKVVKQ